ncbi:hypothetical protein MLD38_000353 [Melastoma candidum]|uniref:Uncharacterized protein n=1 Tax=Melastoma candidum TaxID=119954 RepID=A0ACB9SBR2_9MYRT|nr:hypothetical protein MLD38_000353 [Melastoma candidum]
MFPHHFDVNHSEGDSGASTPSLWCTSPPDTPRGRGDIHPRLSPGLRRQAILQGQRELMDMVRNMPESCYELTLKDLVDLPRPPPAPPRLPLEEHIKRPNLDEHHGRRSLGNGNRTTTMGRSGSQGRGQQQEGLLLKMVFPVPVGMAGRRVGGGRKQRKERSEEDCSEEWGVKEGGDSLSWSTISSSGKSSRSSSANSYGNSILAVRHENSASDGVGGCCSFLRWKQLR